MATKGYDDSPPRNGTIVFYTVLTLAVLVVIKLTLDSYFVKVMSAEVHDKVLTRGMEPVKAMRSQEQAMRDAPAMKRAMDVLSQQGRAASKAIEPKSGMGEGGNGMEEVKGWSKLNRKVLPVAPVAAAADAGVAPAADSNVAPAKPVQAPTAPAGHGATH